jgi:MFS family permease
MAAGSLADMVGRRLVFVLGLAVFTASSLACRLAPEPLFLNVSRAAQGFGAAMMFGTSLALIAQEFQGRERGTALGIWGETTAAAVSIGPLVGGPSATITDEKLAARAVSNSFAGAEVDRQSSERIRRRSRCGSARHFLPAMLRSTACCRLRAARR